MRKEGRNFIRSFFHNSLLVEQVASCSPMRRLEFPAVSTALTSGGYCWFLLTKRETSKSKKKPKEKRRKKSSVKSLIVSQAGYGKINVNQPFNMKLKHHLYEDKPKTSRETDSKCTNEGSI